MKGFIKFTVTLLALVLFVTQLPLQAAATDNSEIDDDSFLSRTNDPHDIFIKIDDGYFTDVETMIKRYYQLYQMTDFTCTFKSSHYFSLNNLSQTSLKQYYNNTQPVGLTSGVCSSVAILDLVLFYKPTMNHNTSFVSFVNQAYANGYANPKGVVLPNKTKNAMTLCASQNSVSKSGAEFTFNKRARTRNALNSGKPVMLGFDNYAHMVVAKGIELFTVSYTDPSDNSPHSYDVEFFVVNDGWGTPYGSVVLSALFSDSTGDAYILQ